MKALYSSLIGNNGVITVFALFFFIFGVIIFSIGLNEVKNSLLAQKWKKTQGKIMKSEIIRDFSGGGGGTHGVGVGHASVKYIVQTEYLYRISSQEYIGNRHTFTKLTFDDYETANILLSSYPVGKIVDVFYSPNDPQQSVLDTSVQKNSFYVIFVGGVFMFLAAGIYFLNRCSCLWTVPPTQNTALNTQTDQN
ncbi:MAG: DUF3592 domain-containing protein [Planctomycetaceae bacterium]|nr:DUF3592 domain-containing protein [Planctomycetaceae bacterium]